MPGRSLIAGKSIQACPVDEEKVQPAVLIEVQPGHTATSCLKKVLVGAFAAEDGLVGKTSALRDIYERDFEVAVISASAEGDADE